MKQETRWVAFDGVPFVTEAECRAYEAKLAHVRIADLPIERIEAALSGADPEIADAIEEVGTRIARARRARGDLRRGARASAEPPASAQPQADAAPASPDEDAKVAA
jgi:hypothetical protein